MIFLELTQPIVMMAIIVAIGFIISRKVEVTKQTRQFISFTVINIAIPCVIIQSIFQAEIDQRFWVNFSIVFVFALFLNFTGILTGFVTGRIFGYKVVDSKQMAILSGCGNTGFFGIPIIYMLFGSTAGVYASIYDFATVLTVFSVGVMLLQGGRFSFTNLKQMINAPFVTLIISLVVAFIGIGVPSFIFDISAMLASLAAPLAMIYIGMLFQEITSEKWMKIKEGYLTFMISSTFIKILILPFIAFIVLNFISIESSIGKVILLQAGMPTFLLATVLFDRYAGSEDIGVMNIIFTSVFSLITLPIIIYVSITFL